MKNHLKRIASPRTWVINRKENKYIARPNPGAHPFDMGLPLVVVMRDVLKLASTMNEVKKALNNNEILVDGKRRKDPRFIVGLFDVLTVPALNKSFRVILDSKGRIRVIEVEESESKIKICKIVGKIALPKGKIQFNLHDGKNIISDKKANVGDSFVLSLPKLEVQEVLSLKEGSTIFLTKGKHAGDIGKLKETEEEKAIFIRDNQEIETAKRYLFVVGNDKPLITVKE